MDKILEIKNLTVVIGKTRVVNDVCFDLYSGRTMALVGGSGSGKTMTALSILDLLPEDITRKKGTIHFRGENIFEMTQKQIRQIRGDRIGMVFQEPYTALNPVMRLGEQMYETIRAHKKVNTKVLLESVKKLLHMVKLSPGIVSQYPHEISGGMQQRVILAMAMALDPDILILDESTTALDVSIQKEVLDLIMRIQQEKKFGILFITHDFSVVNMVADEVCVMKEGVVVEKGSKDRVINGPEHEYTKHLINCIPRLGDKRNRLPA